MGLVEKMKSGPLAPIFTVRFIKFCTVGSSGVGVNLFFLFVFADLFDIHANVSSAMAIFISTLSNFTVNEFWTFRDKRENAARNLFFRLIKFNLVSLGGGLIQWSVFVFFNTVWFLILSGHAQFEAYFDGSSSWLLKPIFSPPEVGGFKYVSQLMGIGVATFWNFLLNFYWTWRQK